MKLKSKEITLETTNKCSAACEICPREKLTQKIMDMDFDLYKKIIDDASQYEMQSLGACGYGEPLMDKLLFKRLNYARQKLPEGKIYVSSTCYLLDKSIYEAMANYVDILKISFYGMSKKTYELSHRGNLKYEVSLKNILGFLQYIKNRNKKPYTITLLTITDTNKNDVQSFIDFWSPLVNEVAVWKPHNYADGRSYRKIDHSRQVSCGRLFNGPLYVHVDGRVSMCCFDYNSQLIIGDMKKQTIYEILHSEAYLKLKKAHQDRNFQGNICYECCQTNFDPTVLVYASNKNRGVGRLNTTLRDMREGLESRDDL